MNWHLRRLLAPMIVIGILIFPLAVSGQEKLGSHQQWRATTRRDQTTDPTQSATAHRQGFTEQLQGTGRRRRRNRRGNAAGDSGTTKTQGNKLTAVRRLNQARLSAAQVKTIRSLPLLRRVVSVQGTIIRPRAGSSLWLLSNGNHLIVGGGELQAYSEVYQRDIGIGTMVWACYCPQYDVNKGSDGCEFDGPASSLKCEQKGGVNCSCKLEDFLITTDGGVIGFEGVPSN